MFNLQRYCKYELTLSFERDEIVNKSNFDIRGFTKPKKYKFGELSHETLGTLLGIFFNKSVVAQNSEPTNQQISKEYRVRYFDIISGRNSHFIIDYFLIHDGRRVAFEYDGPEHYNNVNKIERDFRKNEKLIELGYEKVNVPYYLQLTEDLAKHLFKDQFGVYSEDKYFLATNEIYGTTNEDLMLAPGWHTTPETPANFVEKGIKRFLLEVDEYPKSIHCQLVHSLNLYIKRSNGKEDLIKPMDHIKFREFLELTPKVENLNRFFSSDV